MIGHLFWIAGSLVLAGGGWAVAALFLPPAALALKAVLDFLRSPIGMILAGLVAFLMWSGFLYAEGDLRGRAVTRQAWQAADAAALAAARQRDAQIQVAVKSATDKAAADLDAGDKSL